MFLLLLFAFFKKFFAKERKNVTLLVVFILRFVDWTKNSVVREFTCVKLAKETFLKFKKPAKSTELQQKQLKTFAIGMRTLNYP